MTKEFELYKLSLENWRDYGVMYHGRVEPTWGELKFDWIKTYCIEEFDVNDTWDSPASRFKLWQEELYKSWGHSKESTEHYMAFDPVIDFSARPIFKEIGCNKTFHSFNFMRIPAGMIIPWHCDTYAYFVKKFDIAPEEITRVKRAIVFMEDWSFGQTAQFGRSALCHWEAGDVYSWDHAAWHGVANFGSKPITVMQVTYYDTTDTNKS
jgi:hypothetical protein